MPDSNTYTIWLFHCSGQICEGGKWSFIDCHYKSGASYTLSHSTHHSYQVELMVPFFWWKEKKIQRS